MNRLHHTLPALALLSGTLLPNLAQAEDWIRFGEERFMLSGGAFLPSFDTTLRVDNRTLGIGDDVSLEDDLDVDDDESVYWIGGHWRFASRHRVALSYFRSKRDATAVALDDIQIGDEIFPVGAGLDSEFEIQVIPLVYAYSFMKREKFEFAGSVGLHWYSLDFTVQGTVSLGTEDANAEVTAKADAPLPLFGLRFDYYITPRWSAGAHGEALALEFDDDTFSFSGRAVNVRLSTEYWIWNHFGVGAAVNWFNVDLDVDDSDWRGEFEYDYFGPQLYLTARF